MHRYEYLENRLCRELQNLDEKYRNEQVMLSEGDLKRTDMLAHALKSLVSYEVMVDSQNDHYSYNNSSYAQMGGNSYYDGRGREMSQVGQSGHYPPFYQDNNNNRRW